jgi:hypothetical protein
MLLLMVVLAKYDDFMKNRQQNLAVISASLANIDVKNLGLPSYFRLNTNVSPTEGKIEVVETSHNLIDFSMQRLRYQAALGRFRASLDASYSVRLALLRRKCALCGSCRFHIMN